MVFRRVLRKALIYHSLKTTIEKKIVLSREGFHKSYSF